MFSNHSFLTPSSPPSKSEMLSAVQNKMWVILGFKTLNSNYICVQGMLDTVLEVSWTADQRHLVAAGGDQALRMWEISSGRVRHTLTGHTGKVMHTPASLYMPSFAFYNQLYMCVYLNIHVSWYAYVGMATFSQRMAGGEVTMALLCCQGTAAYYVMPCMCHRLGLCGPSSVLLSLEGFLMIAEQCCLHASNGKLRLCIPSACA